MVESKTRKAAFLREAIRTIGLAETTVAHARFEEYALEAAGSAELITVRAIRADQLLFDVARRLLGPKGRFMMFRPTATAINVPGFSHIETVTLTASPAYLTVCEKMFHVEQ